jgi:hypothetical protein
VAAGTESGAPGRVVEAVEEAMDRLDLYHADGYDVGTSAGPDDAREILGAAMDPALGDDRLVVAGDERRRIVALLRDDYWDGWRFAAEFIERQFGDGSP